MKKLTLAALMAVTTTVSMAQVEISGKIGTYYESSEKAGVNTTSLQQEGTNNIAFKAKEDLGGGLSARVVVETKLFSNDPKSANTQLGDRQSTVGLASKMGSIDMGRSNQMRLSHCPNHDVSISAHVNEISSATVRNCHCCVNSLTRQQQRQRQTHQS